MTKAVTSCDCCGMTKPEVNNWYSVWADGPKEIRVIADAYIGYRDALDVCGEKCLVKVIRRLLHRKPAAEQQELTASITARPGDAVAECGR